MKIKTDELLNKIAIIMITFSILFQFFLIGLNKGPFSGFMWDEYEYLVIAKNLKDGIGYTSDRPPAFPILIALCYQVLGDSFKNVRYITPLLFATNLISLYHFTSKLYNKKTGAVATILFSTLPLSYFLSTRLLTETMFLSFFILSLTTFFFALEKNIKYLLLTGIFTAFSILIRFTGVTLLFIYLFYILITRNFKLFFSHYFYASFFLFFLILLPWFLINLENYKNPLGSFFLNLKSNRIQSVEKINIPLLNFKIDFLPPIYYFFALPLVGSILFFTTIFYFLFYKEIGKREILLILVFFVTFFAQLLFLGRASIRFLNELSVVFAIFSALFFVKRFQLKMKKFLVFVFLVWFINLFLAIEATIAYGDIKDILRKPNFELYIKTKEYIEQNLPEESKILTNIVPVVRDTGRDAINIIFNEESFDKQLKYVDYVIFFNEFFQEGTMFIDKKENLELIHNINRKIFIYKVCK